MASVSFGSFASPRTIRRRHSWRTFLSVPHPRLKTLALFLGALFAVEALIRLSEYGAGATLSDRQSVAACKLPAGAWWRGRNINSSGYWNRELDGAAPAEGVKRIALLGDSTLLAGDADTNVAARLERSSPHLEVDQLALPSAGPREFAAQFAGDVVQRKPSTVVACLPMTPIAATKPADARLAQWHTLHLLQSLVETSPARADQIHLAPNFAEPLDYDTFVRRGSAGIAACRLADDAAAETRRREAQDAVARLAEGCRKQNIKLVLVLVPGEFQYSPQLTAAFCRRQELEPAALDLELPQRRWRAFAEHVGVPTIDLLPAFREAKDVLYLPNSAQWNDRGITLAAAVIARGLE